mmetsp:Transcript_15710/g.23798  ORF Transcript_15710/g.23798 Transcript_15710/m.23798 type:complete len:252 (-) Transcript_15710:439-1194(-)|eukprot:CAMPEP_0178925258 /NCGR_PEP_ID=MMETSP0786-20121207/17803_1 /TAXON_ID=186022 /ORGANISM="Thalassionema frauenfeldii, Strain CCMP 1798" /LENGTH=251 /DNA_ID=CAMNT_0020600101 /DNA_START=100 /DNA_END=855 /DNA_ORIENTATION=-
MGKKGKKRSKKTGKKKPKNLNTNQNSNGETKPKAEDLGDKTVQEIDLNHSTNDETANAGETQIIDDSKTVGKTEPEPNSSVQLDSQGASDDKPVSVSSGNEVDDKVDSAIPTGEANEKSEPTEENKDNGGKPPAEVEPPAESLDEKQTPVEAEDNTRSEPAPENTSNEGHEAIEEAIEVVKSQSGVKVKEEVSQSDNISEKIEKPQIESAQDANKTQGQSDSTQIRSLTAPAEQEISEKSAQADECPCVIL